VLDDPYALAVCATYIQKKFAAVRLKNRFASDSVETVTVDRLLSEFYTAETVGGSAPTGSGDAAHGLGKLSGYTQQYRDVNLNISVEFPGRETEFICEVQLTLSTISILKKSEQKIYSLLRMENPAELREQYVFSRKTEEDESTVLTSHSAVSTVSTGLLHLENVPQDSANALSAAGLTDGTPHSIPLPIDVEDGGPAQPLVESQFETDLGDMAVEVDVAGTSNEEMGAQPQMHRHKNSEVIQSDAPVGFGIKQGMFSCACEPCESASGDPVLDSGGPVLVSALPSSLGTMQPALQPALQQAAQLR
jgi:hypothetical protein